MGESSLSKPLNDLLSALTRLSFFRYYRVNLNQKCTFGLGDHVCRAQGHCHLISEGRSCPVPQAFVEEDLKLMEAPQLTKYQLFDFVKPFYDAQPHDWSFDSVLKDNIYIDLLADREEFTGYQGQELWKKIYLENCVGFSESCNNSPLLYRIVSGMHTSVSSHICEYYKWGSSEPPQPYPELYYQKVAANPERVENLLFAWEVLLKAFVRYYDIISATPIKTGDFITDIRTEKALKDVWYLLREIKDASFPIEEFAPNVPVDVVKEVFLRYFTNIHKLMDCVDCVKCKVYGKMQVMGVGVALRILMNPSQRKLTRNELVALVNTLAKWTESVEIFKRMQARLSFQRFKMAALITVTFLLLVTALLSKIQLLNY